MTLTLFASLFSAVFTRRWLGWRIARAAGFGMFLALVSQVVILLSTAGSYLLDLRAISTSRSRSTAAEAVGFGAAMAIRLGGLVVNTLLNGISGALGWALGGLLPVGDRR